MKRFLLILIATLTLTAPTHTKPLLPARAATVENCDPQTTVRLSELAALMVGVLETQYSGQLEILGEQLRALRALRDFLLTSDILNPKYDLLFKQLHKAFPDLLDDVTYLIEILEANKIGIVNLVSGQLILSRFFETLCQILP